MGVLDARFIGQKDDPVLRDLFTTSVRGRVVKLLSDTVDVIEGSKLDRLIQVNASSCSNASCLAQFAKKAGLDYLLETKLTIHKSKWTACLKLACAKDESVRDEETQTFANEDAAQAGLPALAEAAVKSLVKKTSTATEAEETPVAPPPGGTPKLVVNFSSTPSGAAVTLDGKFLCQTPNGKSVFRGDHWIEMGKDGYRSKRDKVTVNRNGQELSWSLDPIQTRLTLDAVDDRTGGDLVGDVYVDGAKVGQTPFDGLVPVATQRIEVAPEDFDRQTVSVTLEEGKAANATAHFRSNPPQTRQSFQSNSPEIKTGSHLSADLSGIDFSAPQIIAYEPLALDADGNEVLENGTSAFISAHKDDPARIGKALLEAGGQYYRSGKIKKAQVIYQDLLDWYHKNKKAVAPAIPCEAWYAMGLLQSAEANALKVGGEVELHASSMSDVSKVLKKRTSEFVESIVARSNALKPASEAFGEVIDLQNREWTLKATMAMADNAYKLAIDAYSSQPAKTDNRLDLQLGILYRSQVGGSIPTLTQKAAKAYSGLLDLAYAAGIHNELTKTASQRLLICYLIQGLSREGIGDAIASEPCPSTAQEGSEQYKEECENHATQKEDKQRQFQKAAVKQGYAPGVEIARKYGIEGQEREALVAKIQVLDPGNSSLQSH